MNEIKQDSAGSKPALKHVVVFDVQHSQINALSQKISEKFCEKAKALGIKLKKRGKNRNVPGQPEAVECLFTVSYMDMTKPLDGLVNNYIEDLIKKVQGAQ